MPGFCPVHVPLWREGEEYNSRKANNSAQVLTYGRLLGFYPPAASSAVESLAVGALNANRKGFAMKNNPTATRLPSVLSFEGTDIHIVDHEGCLWVPAAELSRALGYTRGDTVSRIFQRNSDEFTAAMYGTVKLTVPGNRCPIPVNIFSPRGCYLVAMLAKETWAIPASAGKAAITRVNII